MQTTLGAENAKYSAKATMMPDGTISLQVTTTWDDKSLLDYTPAKGEILVLSFHPKRPEILAVGYEKNVELINLLPGHVLNVGAFGTQKSPEFIQFTDTGSGEDFRVFVGQETHIPGPENGTKVKGAGFERHVYRGMPAH